MSPQGNRGATHYRDGLATKDGANQRKGEMAVISLLGKGHITVRKLCDRNSH
jgi:hypothetical protein